MKFINKYSFIIVFIIVLCLFIPKVINSKNKSTDKNDILSSEISDNSSIQSEAKNNVESENSSSSEEKSEKQESSFDTTVSSTQEKSAEVQSKTTAVNQNQTSTIYLAPEVGDFKQGDISYFDDALFIGDSRIVGLRDYGTLKNADYFVNVGMSIYNLKKNPIDINGIKTGFDEFINKKQYKKIYISLGINEIGYNKEKTIQQYNNLIKELYDIQKDAIVFINANLLVTEHCSNTDKYSHNNEIIQYNNMLSKLADGQKSFYIDVNTVFGDGRGNMQPQFSGDGTHILAKYYSLWCDWLLKRII